MKNKTMTGAVYVVSILGILLHVYLTFIHAATGSLFNLIVPSINAIPFLACIILTMTTTKPIMPLCASLILLILDLYLFKEYLLSIKIHRFALLEIYQVMFKTAVIVPIGCLIGFLIDKLINHDAVN